MGSSVTIVIWDVSGQRVDLLPRMMRGLSNSVAVRWAGSTGKELGTVLRSCLGGVWLVRVGSWRKHMGELRMPPASATGLPLVVLGACWEGKQRHPNWEQQLRFTGGNFLTIDPLLNVLPSLYLDPKAVASLAGFCDSSPDVESAFRSWSGSFQARWIHDSQWDVHYDPRLRVAQIVTTLQRGGAERVTLNLAEEYTQRDMVCLVISLGKPTRTSFPAPTNHIDVSTCRTRQERLQRLQQTIQHAGIDAIHGHLIDHADIRFLSQFDIPLLLTIHNTAQAWPRGTTDLQRPDSTLLVACAKAVEKQLQSLGTGIPTRTVWNGIQTSRYASSAPSMNWHEQKVDRLTALANPRPQKRLHLLPAIFVACQQELQRRGMSQPLSLSLIGEAAADANSQDCLQAIHKAIAEQGLSDQQVEWITTHPDQPLQKTILISPSLHEGLSLAHLEALAAGCPVVATDVGGTSEIAQFTSACSLVPVDAKPEVYAKPIVDWIEQGWDNPTSVIRKHFDRSRMADRYELFTRQAIRSRLPQSGLCLIINNFSVGGAQSSARRLLQGLAQRGLSVRAVVLEEQAEYPTPGRVLLQQAGIPVHVIPRWDVEEGIPLLLQHLAEQPPQVILFWNALTSYKVRLADALFHTPILDISPGEMYFDSLQKFFQKPRAALPYQTENDYGQRLAGLVVKYAAERARAEQLGCPVHVIPNGVPIDPQPRERCVSQPLILGTAVRIHPQKKLEELLLALRRIHDPLLPYQLRIAGGVEKGCEEYAQQLQQMAEGLSVQWFGDVRDMASFLRSLDLFVMIGEPAGCPNASLEAMASGLAIIGTDVGGMSEQVQDGVNGRLVPRGDITALAEAIREVVRRPEQIQPWGQVSWQRAGKLFSVDRMVEDYLWLIRSVCPAFA